MKLGTIILLPDGREGTICWHHLNGYGGVWGRHDFSHIDISKNSGFVDELPAPEFMLRPKEVEYLLRQDFPEVECVGEDYVIEEKEGT